MNKTGIIILIIIVLAIVGFFVYSDDTAEAPTDTEDLVVDETARVLVTVRNVHDSQVLSPGVYVVHTDEASLDFEGDISPAPLEPLAEYGSHADFADFARAIPGVVDVITIDAPVLPGEETSFTVSVDAEEMSDFRLSGIMMLVGTNDGYALLNAADLEDATRVAINYDNGTEENEAPGGGFDAGQPDPSRGEENVENGTPTDPVDPVSLHDQVTEAVMEVILAVQ